MGWDIKGWLFGRPEKDNSKKVIRELRNDRNDLKDQLKKQGKQAKEERKQFISVTEELSAGISALQIQNQQQADQFNAAYTQQAASFEQSLADQSASFNALMIRQNEQAAAAAAQAKAIADAQIAQAEAAAAEQRRIATNLGNAFVPDAIEGAMRPVKTEGSLDGARKKKNNELSELSIVSDASVNPMAKAGLQIA